MKSIKLFSVFVSLISILTFSDLSGKTYQIDLENICLAEEEIKLHRLINEYRKSHDLDNIPLSLSLTVVAKAHAADLFYNNPDDDYLCNMHSWSDKGDWEACCYTSDHAHAECMWNKPKEITNYKGDGYEIVFYFSPVTDDISMAKEALEGWKGSPGHNNTIVNAGIFRNAEWNAIGVGIYEEYVTVWFGEKQDEEGAPEKCEP